MTQIILGLITISVLVWLLISYPGPFLTILFICTLLYIVDKNTD